jgi:RNA polymerase sigma-70 factor (ECF subfamily)
MHANPIHADLAEALAALPAAARACLHDAYWEGLTQREIARRQRRPLGTVKSDIRRTLMALRAAMRRES